MDSRRPLARQTNVLKTRSNAVVKPLVADENEAQAQAQVRLKKSAEGGVLAVQDKKLLHVVKPNRNVTGPQLLPRKLNVPAISQSIPFPSEKPKKRASQEEPKPFVKLPFGGGVTLMPVEFTDDIDVYLRHLETKQLLPKDFLARNPATRVDGRMRSILVDWLISVQMRFELGDETLSLAVWILDRALLKMQTDKDNLQLVGVASLFLATKFEELACFNTLQIMVPHISDFVYVSADAYSKRDILLMEQTVLRSIGFQCSAVHSIQFLRRYQFHCKASKSVYNLAKYITQVALVAYSLSQYKPSMVAAVSMFLAAKCLAYKLNQQVFSAVMLIDVEEVARLSAEFVPHVIQMAAGGGRLQALFKKHSSQAPIKFTREQLTRMEGLCL